MTLRVEPTLTPETVHAAVAARPLSWLVTIWIIRYFLDGQSPAPRGLDRDIIWPFSKGGLTSQPQR